mgnify:CR=1 FL=1
MANFNFNKVILGGRLTADPELKTTQSGIAVVSFSVAVNRRYTKNAAQQNETDFFNVTAWRQTAEFVCTLDFYIDWFIFPKTECNIIKEFIINKEDF